MLLIIVIVILLSGAGMLLGLLLRLLRKPIKWAFKLLLHALSGFVFLFFLNLVGALVGINLPLTWPHAVVAGILGLPGVLLLLLLQYIL